MTMAILGGLLLQWPMGVLSDKFDRTFVLSLIGLMITILSVVIF